jgi:multidrug efflux pump subunit AcrB
VQRVVNEVRSAVDRIPSFPELTEDPKVRQITFREAAINLSVVVPQDKSGAAVNMRELRDVAEQVRDELLMLPSVSQVSIKGALDYQIDIEIDEDTLRKHGLSLPQVAEIVRRENLEMPAGMIRSEGQEILLRGNNKRLVGEEIAKLPLAIWQTFATTSRMARR